MTEREVLALALCVAAAAWLAPPVTPALVTVLVGLAALAGVVWDPRKGFLAVALLTLVVVRAGTPPHDPAVGRHDTTVQVRSDPVTTDWSVRADARLGDATVRLQATDDIGRQLAAVQAGDRLDVVVEVEARSDPRWPPTARLVELRHRRPGGPHWRIANGVRDLVAAGAAVLGVERRALFTGLVYGDDREQSAVVADDFRGAGLTHLLAVSGQNVAFAVALASPVIRRFGTRGRFLLTLAVLGVFATATRFEPSVLRATAMAGVAATASAAGREASSRRTLAAAVVVLVTWRPSLVGSLAFQLSVCASGGIVLLSSRLADLLPGPRPVAEALGVTVAAQLAVAPLLTATFGPVALVSVPANLAAGWAAGAVMTWGLTGGVLAGLVPALAPLVHLPTRGLLWWLEAVARAAGRAPLGWVGTTGGLLVLGASAAAAWRPRLGPVASATTGAVVLVAMGSALGAPPGGLVWVAGGSQVWRAGSGVVVVLGERSSERDLLAALRTNGVRAIDVLVLPGGSAREAALARTVRDRHPVGAVWVPAGHRRLDHVSPPAGATARVGGLTLTVVADAPRLVVRVTGVVQVGARAGP